MLPREREGVPLASRATEWCIVNWAPGLGTSESSAALTGQHELQSEITVCGQPSFPYYWEHDLNFVGVVFSNNHFVLDLIPPLV